MTRPSAQPPRRNHQPHPASPRTLTGPHITYLLLSIYWARCRYSSSTSPTILDVDVRLSLFDNDERASAGGGSGGSVSTRLLLYLLRSWDGHIEPAGSLRELCDELRKALLGPAQRDDAPGSSSKRQAQTVRAQRIESVIAWLEEQWQILVPLFPSDDDDDDESLASQSGVGVGTQSRRPDDQPLPVAPLVNHIVKIVEAASMCVEVTENDDEEEEDEDEMVSPKGSFERRSPLGIAIRRMRLALEGMDEFREMPRLARELVRWTRRRRGSDSYHNDEEEDEDNARSLFPTRMQLFHHYRDARRRGDYSSSKTHLYDFFSIPPPISHRTRSPLHPNGHPLGPNAPSVLPPPLPPTAGSNQASGSASTTTGQTRTKLHHHALLNLAGLHVEWGEWDAAQRALKEATSLCKAERDSAALEACQSLARRVDAALERRAQLDEDDDEVDEDARDIAAVEEALLRQPLSQWVPPSREGTWRAAEATATMTTTTSGDDPDPLATSLDVPGHSLWATAAASHPTSSGGTAASSAANAELRALVVQHHQDTPTAGTSSSSSSSITAPPARLTPDDLWDALRVSSTALSATSRYQILESIQRGISLPFPTSFLRALQPHSSSSPGPTPTSSNANIPHPTAATHVSPLYARPWLTLSRLHSGLGEERQAAAMRRLARAEPYGGDEGRRREDEWSMRFDEAWSWARAGQFERALHALSDGGEQGWLRELVEEGEHKTYTRWVRCVLRCLYLWKRRSGVDEPGRRRIALLATGRKGEEWDVELDDEASSDSSPLTDVPRPKTRSIDARLNELITSIRSLITAPKASGGGVGVAPRILPLLSTFLHRTRLLGRPVAHRRCLVLLAQVQAFYLDQRDVAIETMQRVLPGLLGEVSVVTDDQGGTHVAGGVGDVEEVADGLVVYAQLLLAKARAVEQGLEDSSSFSFSSTTTTTTSPPLLPPRHPPATANELKHQALAWLHRARDAYVAACHPRGCRKGLLQVDVFLGKLYGELAAGEGEGKEKQRYRELAEEYGVKVRGHVEALRRGERRVTAGKGDEGEEEAAAAGGDVAFWEELIARVGAKVAAPRC